MWMSGSFFSVGTLWMAWSRCVIGEHSEPAGGRGGVSHTHTHTHHTSNLWLYWFSDCFNIYTPGKWTSCSLQSFATCVTSRGDAHHRGFKTRWEEAKTFWYANLVGAWWDVLAPELFVFHSDTLHNMNDKLHVWYCFVWLGIKYTKAKQSPRKWSRLGVSWLTNTHCTQYTVISVLSADHYSSRDADGNNALMARGACEGGKLSWYRP